MPPHPPSASPSTFDVVDSSGSATAAAPVAAKEKLLAHPKYRPDIDGLRALAVSSVVIFHFFPERLKGGFIGVDVFFVISGFLISSIILESLAKQSFSLVEFYARRIRRIFPALIIVLVTSFAFGWFELFADEYKQLGKHISGGAGFVSNFLFWHEAGYFDNSAGTKPLLHLWTLAIEEQFYLIWPVALWAAWSRKLNVAWLILAMAVISFGLNLATVHGDPVAAFYSPQTRFWELLSGAGLAWLTIFKRPELERWRLHANAGTDRLFQGRTQSGFDALLSLAGLALFVFSVTKINDAKPFPGLWALCPVASAVLIILAGNEAWPNRLILSNRLAVFIGLISYPLYLWHWPLRSFATIIDGALPDRPVRIGLTVLSVVLAWATYRFIETPIRTSRASIVAVPLFGIMIVIGAAGYLTFRSDGLPWRATVNAHLHKDYIGHEEYLQHLADHYFDCADKDIFREAERYKNFVRCKQSKPGPDIDVVLVGDSHIEHLFTGLADALPGKNVAYYLHTGAPPFLDNKAYATIFDSILRSRSIKKVIWGWYWTALAPSDLNADFDQHVRAVADSFTRSGKQFYITGDIPRYPFDPKQCALQRPFFLSANYCSMPTEAETAQSSAYVARLSGIAASDPRIELILMGQYFCDQTHCSMLAGDSVTYRDSNHLNLVGSKLAAEAILRDHPSLGRDQ